MHRKTTLGFKRLFGKPSATFASFLILGMLTKMWDIFLLFGISISLSSLFIFLNLRLFGLWRGLASAVVCLAFSVYYLDGPYYEAMMLLEVAAVGLALRSNRRRGSMSFYDFLYWLVFGVPLILCLSGAHFGGLSKEGLLLTLVAASNALFNVLAADIVSRVLEYVRWFKGGRASEASIPYRQLLFYMLMASVTFPFLLYFMISSWHSNELVVRDSHKLAVNAASIVETELSSWDAADIAALRLNGVLQSNHLRDTIARISNQHLFQVAVVDSNANLLAAASPSSPLGKPFDWRDGANVRAVADGYYERIPESDSLWPTSAWGAGAYVYESQPAELPFRILVFVPLHQYQQDLIEEKLFQFTYLIVFVLCAALFAMLLNRVLVRRLSELAAVTTGLPEKLEQQHSIRWPQSYIGEVRSLIHNFREMTLNLLQMFHEAKSMNAVLQDNADKLKLSEERLHRLAYYDNLTGLPNRTHLVSDLQLLLRPGEPSTAVVFLDLNQFKQVNDTLGHSMGDLLLQEASNRFAYLRSHQCEVYRIGGDEFVFVLQQASESSLRMFEQQLLGVFEHPVQLGEHKVFATASVGISLYPQDGSDMETILKNADMAMYDAKDKGGNRIVYFDRRLDQAASERLMLDTGIREALLHGHFRLHYQPKVRTEDGTISGIEALIRWDHPELGRISPGRFIPFAEKSGQIVDIDAWVLREACKQNKAWQDIGLPKVPISVNISVRHFYQGDLIRTIQAALDESGLDASYLTLEITEGLFMREMEQVLETIHRIREMGVRFSIDDFGTGYSSLNQLQRLPVHQVKLDRSFIVNIADDAKKASIVKAIIELAHSMKLQVVAEGIETKEELEFFARCKCDELQGYLFSQAVPGDEFSGQLKRGCYETKGGDAL